MRKEILLGIIIILLLVSGIYLFSTQSTLQGGLTINSISGVKTISNDAELSKSNFRITTKVTGTGEQIVGFTSSDFETKLKQDLGYDTNFDITISGESLDETLDIEFINEKIPVYRYAYEIHDDPLFGDTEPCPDNTWKQKDFFGVGDLHCVIREQVAVKGHLQPKTVNQNVKLKVSNGIDTFNVEVGNQNRKSTIGNIGFVEFTGTLLTGDQLPDLSSYVVLARTKGTNRPIQINSNELWDNYKVTQKEIEKEIEDVFNSRFGVAEIVWTERLTKATVKDNDILIQLLRDVDLPGVSKQTKTKDGLRVTLNRRWGNPELVFSLNAKWIGIKISSGIPKIIGASCDEFTSGESDGFAHATIKNTGIANANFLITLEDCSTFSTFSSFTNQLNLNPGDTKDIDIKLNTGDLTNAVESCNLKVTDSSNPNNFDSKSVTCKVNPPLACEPKKQEKVGNCVFECNSEGSSSSQAFCCGDKEVPTLTAQTNQYSCMTLDTTKTKTTLVPGICEPIIGFAEAKDTFFGRLFGLEDRFSIIPNFSCASTIEIVAFLSLLLGIFISFLILRDTFIKKKGKDIIGLVIVSLLSLTIGIALSFLIQKFIFWGVVLGVLLLIIKVVIK